MQQGNSQVADIAQLIEEHKNLIFKVVNSYCSNSQDQEDLIQEIIFNIIKGYKNFDHQVKITTWMYKVAFNVSISHYRKAKSRQKYVFPLPESLVQIEEPETTDLDSNIIKLRKFIGELNPLNKAIIIMYLDGNNHNEISLAMGISVSNVGTKINRIKKQLKNKFNL